MIRPAAGEREARRGTQRSYRCRACAALLAYWAFAKDFPHAQRAAAEVLALPIYPELTPEQREYVVGQIAEFVRS
jgi:dTDP-4-amino-4,6-dideoxygalactose transaminase